MVLRHVSRRQRAAFFALAVWLGCSAGEPAAPPAAAAGDLHLSVSSAGGALRVGDNDLEVRVSDAAGKPVDDASVALRWTMAAMGGMPAMRGAATAEPRGGGVYRARVELGMNGSWRLEIEARRPGGALASIAGALVTGRAEIPLETERAGEPTAAGEVRVDAARRQAIGIRTGVVERGRLVIPLRAVGRVALDERRVSDVSFKVRGWITKLHVSAVGDTVRAGDPLLELYSPDLLTAQKEYLRARRSAERAGDGANETAAALARAARTRLRLWDVSEAELAALERGGEPSQSLTLRSPVSGSVVEKDVVAGGAVEPGARLFRIAPLDPVWVEAEVSESRAGLVRAGQAARISLPYLAAGPREGRIAFVYPMLDGERRTLRVRIELANADLALRPDAYADVEIDVDLGERTLVPQSAVLYSGPRRIVFVDVGEGRLRPREVRVGAGNGEVLEVLEGLEPGEQIVLSGNYLVASESRLRSALDAW